MKWRKARGGDWDKIGVVVREGGGELEQAGLIGGAGVALGPIGEGGGHCVGPGGKPIRRATAGGIDIG